MSNDTENNQKESISYVSTISEENGEEPGESRFFLIPYLTFSIWMNIGAHLDA